MKPNELHRVQLQHPPWCTACAGVAQAAGQILNLGLKGLNHNYDTLMVRSLLGFITM
jgi:hypothetical protein